MRRALFRWYITLVCAPKLGGGLRRGAAITMARDRHVEDFGPHCAAEDQVPHAVDMVMRQLTDTAWWRRPDEVRSDSAALIGALRPDLAQLEIAARIDRNARHHRKAQHAFWHGEHALKL